MADENEPNPVQVDQLSNAISAHLVSARHHNIPQFTGGKGDCPIKFIRIFERVAKALKWDDQAKRDKFPNYLTGAGEEFHYMFVDCVEDANKPGDWDELKGLFLNHFMRGDYKSHLSKELRNKRKSENESMVVYITSVLTLCHDLDENMSEEQVVGYCLDGMDQDVQAQIQMFNPTTIAELMRYAKNVELSLDRLRSLSLKDKSEVKPKIVNAINSENNDSEVEKLDPLLNAVNKLTESVNNLQTNRSADKFKNKGNYQKNNFNNGFNRNFRGNNRNNGFNPNNGNNLGNFGQNSANHFNNGQNRNFANNGHFNNNNQRKNTNYGNNNFRSYSNQGLNQRNNNNCYNCGKPGHIKANCRAPQNNARTDFNRGETERNANSQTNQANNSNGGQNAAQIANHNRYEMNANSNIAKNLIEITVQIKGKSYRALVDSGAELTLIRKAVSDELNLALRQYNGPKLETCDKTVIEIFGETFVEMSIFGEKEHKMSVPVLIVERLPADILLGIDSLQMFNIFIDCKNKCAQINGQAINAISRTVIPQCEWNASPAIKSMQMFDNTSNLNKNSSEGVVFENRSQTECVSEFNEKGFESNGIEINDSNDKNKCLLHLLNDTVIEPKSVSVIKLKANQKLSDSQNLLSFTDDYYYLKNGILLQNSISKVIANTVTVKAINLSNNRKDLKCGDILGKFETISSENILSIDLSDNSMQTEFNDTNCNFQINSIDSEINYKFETEKEFETSSIILMNGSVICGPHLTKEQKSELKELLEKFPNVLTFDENKVGQIKNYQYKLIVNQNANPVRHSPARTSFENMKIIDSEVDKLLKKGIIQKSLSDWSSRTVLVKRKDGRPRVCLDLRDVNNLLEADSYPVPDIQMCFANS